MLAILFLFLHQLLRNLLVQHFLHRQGDDDFVAAFEVKKDSVSCNASDE